jgi:activator of the mannose operon (transcriptional antiterminator)
VFVVNERQTKMMRTLLLHSNEAVRVQQLADDLQCSEKTVRNDLKTIQKFLELKSNKATLNRKPGVGLQLLVDEEEKKRIFNFLYQSERSTEKDRILEITYHLLVENKPLTLQGMADQYYATATEIRSDLLKINKWVKTFGLSVVSKQRLGSIILGKEIDKRNALAHLSELVAQEDYSSSYILQLFPDYEVNLVRHSLAKVLGDYKWQLSDEKVESLVIHALVMMKRSRQNSSIIIKDEEINTVRHSQEYSMTESIFKHLQKALSLSLPNSEKVYFTWHLMSCNQENLIQQTDDRTNTLMNNILNQLTTQLQIMTMSDFKNDSILMDGLRVHLPSTVHRVRYGLSIRNPMLYEIKKMYPYMFSMVVMALEEVNKNYSIHIPEDEAAYLVLHFQASIERLQKKRETKKKVLIVCELGVGMSHLLQAKLEQSYKGIDITGCIGVHDLEETLTNHRVDFILSTRELEEKGTPHLVISPLLKAEDRQKLDQFLQKSTENSLFTDKLLEWLRNGVVHFDLDPVHRYEVIEMLGKEMTEKGFVTPGFSHHAVIRERTSGTAIGGGVAIPHAPPEEVNESTVAMAVLKEPIEWGNELVSVVFLLAIAKQDQEKIRPLMHMISRLSTKPELVQKMIDARSVKDLEEVLR